MNKCHSADTELHKVQSTIPMLLTFACFSSEDDMKTCLSHLILDIQDIQKHGSTARLALLSCIRYTYLMETSASFTHSTTVVRCRCTACVSTPTTLASVFRATYRILLSLNKSTNCCCINSCKHGTKDCHVTTHMYMRLQITSTLLTDDFFAQYETWLLRLIQQMQGKELRNTGLLAS